MMSGFPCFPALSLNETVKLDDQTSADGHIAQSTLCPVMTPCFFSERFANKVRVNKELGSLSHVFNDWKHTVHLYFPHSGLSHNRGNMWAILLLTLLAQTFAADGK